MTGDEWNALQPKQQLRNKTTGLVVELIRKFNPVVGDSWVTKAILTGSSNHYVGEQVNIHGAQYWEAAIISGIQTIQPFTLEQWNKLQPGDMIKTVPGHTWGDHINIEIGVKYDETMSGANRYKAITRSPCVAYAIDTEMTLWTYTNYYPVSVAQGFVKHKTVIGSTKKTIPEWPHTCTGCTGPAYAGFNVEVHCKNKCKSPGVRV